MYMEGEYGYFKNIQAKFYYNRMKQLSQSWLSYFDPTHIAEKTPAHFYYDQIDPGEGRAMTDALRFGQAFHLRLLEPKEYDQRVSFWEETKTTGLKFQAAEEATLEDEMLIPSHWNDQIERMGESISHHKQARELIELCEDSESTLLWKDEETGVDCKGRLDLCSRKHNVLVDLKKTRCAGEQKFKRSIQDFRYHVQEYGYTNGYERATGNKAEAFAFICVEDFEPHCVAVYQLTEGMRKAGEFIYQRNISRYAECLERNVWPGYAEEAQFLEANSWYMKQLEDNKV